MVKLIILMLCGGASIFWTDIAFSQTGIIDSSSVRALETQINAASLEGDYRKAATLLKQVIALGNNDSAVYYALAISLGLAGDKADGKKYLDTAQRLGMNISSDGGIAAAVLGIPQATNNGESIAASEINRIDSEAVAASLTMPKGYNSVLLYQLYYEDQKERKVLMKTSDDVDTMFLMMVEMGDAERRKTIDTLLSKDQITTALDLEEAAMILEHGSDTNDYTKARELALRSVKMGNVSAKWLAAATLDRYLVAKGLPQKYGTQSSYNEKTGKLELDPVDPSVTDEERAKWNVPPLKNALRAYER